MKICFNVLRFNFLSASLHSFGLRKDSTELKKDKNVGK